MTPAPNSAVLESPEATEAGRQVVDTDTTLLEELLVEEISIDGMCGVY